MATLSLNKVATVGKNKVDRQELKSLGWDQEDLSTNGLVLDIGLCGRCCVDDYLVVVNSLLILDQLEKLG